MSEQDSNPPSNQELQRIEQEIIKANPKAFKNIPQNQRQEILRTISSITLSVQSGPLPSPENLAKYAQIIPEGADRIMKMSEKQQTHRIEMENKVITSQLSQSKLGQVFGLIIGLAALASGTFVQ